MTQEKETRGQQEVDESPLPKTLAGIAYKASAPQPPTAKDATELLYVIADILDTWRMQSSEDVMEAEMPAKWVLKQIAHALDAVQISEAIGIVADVRRLRAEAPDHSAETALAAVVCALEGRRLRHG